MTEKYAPRAAISRSNILSRKCRAIVNANLVSASIWNGLKVEVRELIGKVVDGGNQSVDGALRGKGGKVSYKGGGS